MTMLPGFASLWPSSGRGAFAMDLVNRAFGYGMGPRATMALGVACYAIGALLLRPVVERRREDVAPLGAEAVTA